MRIDGRYLVKISVYSDWRVGEWAGGVWSVAEYPTVKHDYQLFDIKCLR